MKVSSQLTVRVPVALAAALFLAGCYTVLKHPTTDLTADGAHDGDYRYSDCASCHSEGFSQPLVPDPYGYTSSWYFDYYGCPWWLPDCGYGYGGNAPGGRWSRGGHAGGSGSETTAGDDERHVGGRGGVRAGGAPARVPVYNPAPATGGSAAPSVGPQTQGTGGSGSSSPSKTSQVKKEPRHSEPQPAPSPTPPPQQNQNQDKNKDKPDKDKPKDGNER